MRIWWLIVLLCLNYFSIGQNDTITGLASYYAKRFEGRRTASGEKFRNDSLTAAHKTLPFGSIVKVTNLKNDSVVMVRVNDRLPKYSKRDIDLTIKAAKQLNFIKSGLAKVRLEVISDTTSMQQSHKALIMGDTLEVK